MSYKLPGDMGKKGDTGKKRSKTDKSTRLKIDTEAIGDKLPTRKSKQSRARKARAESGKDAAASPPSTKKAAAKKNAGSRKSSTKKAAPKKNAGSRKSSTKKAAPKKNAGSRKSSTKKAAPKTRSAVQVQQSDRRAAPVPAARPAAARTHETESQRATSQPSQPTNTHAPPTRLHYAREGLSIAKEIGVLVARGLGKWLRR